MAESTSQLQRIASLVTRTSAITHKQRGMRIEAEDWNTVVEVLLGILQVDRLQETSVSAQLEQRFAPRDHEHLGVVSLAWLDADLQSRIQGSGAVSTREVLAEMDRKLQTMRDDITALKATVDAHQQQMDRSAVAELDRAKALRDFQDRFDGVANLNTLVGTLSADVGNLRSSYNEVLKLKTSLTDPQGNPLDVAKMRQDVTDLQGLRDNMKGVDGNLLSMREIEVRLTDVANAVGVGTNSLEKQLADFGAQMETKISENTNKLIASALEGVKTDSQALETRLTSKIQESVTQVTEAAKAETASQIAASEARQNATLNARLQEATASISASTLNSARALIDERLAGLPQIARDAANAAAVEMGKTISTDLQNRFSADIAAQVKALEDRMTQRITPLETGLQTLRDAIGATVEAAVQSSTTTLRAFINEQIASGMTAMRQQLQTSIQTQVASSVEAALKDLDARIGSAVQARMPEITKLVGDSVARATRNVNEEIAAEVKRQIADLNLGGTIKSAIDASSRELTTSFTSQLAAQDARLTTMVSTLGSTLRGEFRAGIDTSISRSKEEILSTVNTRIDQITIRGRNTPIG